MEVAQGSRFRLLVNPLNTGWAVPRIPISGPMTIGDSRGLFITFEGGEGAGKSTQIALLAASLDAQGREVIATKAPGGSDLGVRDLLLNRPDLALAPRAEALLFLADIAQLNEMVIRPALDRGAVVLCDRYVDSTIAYQGYARGLGVDEVSRVADWAIGGQWPDLTVFFDIPVHAGLARKSGDEWNRMEAEGLAFHENVRRGLLGLVADNPSRFAVVSGEGPIEQVANDVLAVVTTRLG